MVFFKIRTKSGVYMADCLDTCERCGDITAVNVVRVTSGAPKTGVTTLEYHPAQMFADDENGGYACENCFSAATTEEN